MKNKRENGIKKRNWLTTFAVLMMIAGLMAFAVPLVWQQINYHLAAQKAAETEKGMVIPQENAYQPVDYALMEKGETPSYSPEEMQEAASPPSFLEELGITGNPSSFLFGITSASAQAAEPKSMREALNDASQTLKMVRSQALQENAVLEALANARTQVENAFFLLTLVQPIRDVEALSSLSNQKVVDGITRGDKTITAARDMIYASLTDLEQLLKQVEDQAEVFFTSDSSTVGERHLSFQLDMLSSYLSMLALHLPEDDYHAAMAQHRELAALAGNTSLSGDENDYAPIDKDSGDVKRSYLLEIPDIKLKVTAYRSGSFNKMYQNMRSGAAMFPRAPEPDTSANICISAHRTGTRDYFRNLHKLSAGDVIYLHTSHLGSFKYEVVKVAIIENDDWSVSRDVGYPALTLLSCQAYEGVGNAQRIMVRAKLVGIANDQQ